MSRVQCVECGIAVVVDPSGICPEGHLVGNAGVRVAGAMGSDVPHPHEPEPWVATVVLDDVDASPAAPERAIRPVRVAGADAATEAGHDEVADHESMLRELHALGDVRDATPPSAVPEAATAPVAGAPPVAHVPPPPQEQVAEGFAELSALEAAFHALGYDEDATSGGDQPAAPTANADPTPSPAGDGPGPDTHGRAETGPSDDLADVEGLFAPRTATDRSDGRASSAQGPGSIATATRAPSAPPASSPTPSAPAPGPDRDHVAGHATGVPPSSAPTVPGTPDADPPEAAAPSPAPEPAEPLTTDADDAPRARDAGLDITNFTARGGKVGSGRGGRRKLFGR